MERKIVSGIVLTLLLIGILKLGFGIQLVKADPRIWTVDDDGPADFSSIQEAINSSLVADGDTIFVRSGTYYERVVVNKSVSLIGEDKTATVIIANLTEFDYAVYISANNVTVSGFEIRDYEYGGIVLDHSSNCTVSGNIVKAVDAILVYGGSGNKISDNDIEKPPGSCVFNGLELADSDNNVVTGNYLGSYCDQALTLSNSHNNYIASNLLANHLIYSVKMSGSNNNSIVGNTIYSAPVSMGGHAYLGGSSGNVLYHNSFLTDGEGVGPVIIYVLDGSVNNTWDNGYPSGGNYWSNYTDADLFSGPSQNVTGSDGIGDSPYVIDDYNQDNYPLMNPLVALTIHQPEGGYLEPITPYVSFQEPDTYYYQLDTSVVVIAHILEYFIFEHFILDGSPVDTESASITILMDKDHTLSANFTQYGPLLPVGGIYVPVNKLELLTQYIGLTILLAVAVITVSYVKKRKRNTEIIS